MAKTANSRHSLKDAKSGKFRSKKPPWDAPGSKGFFNWLSEVKPRILTRANKYEPFKPTENQKKIINQILSTDHQNNFLHSMSLLVQPRRHGKSTVFALIILWLFTSLQNITIQILGTHEQHCRRTMYRMLKRIIRNTPALSKLISEKDIQTYEIKYRKRGNVIQMSSTSISGSFGDKIDVLWTSDLHATPDLEPFNALQAALLDSQNSVVFIDSNCDYIDGPVHKLQKEAETDETIFCEHTFYGDFKEYEEKAPPWINRQKAKRLKKTTLPTDFSRDILGKRLDAKNALFPSNIIELCKSKFKCPVSDITELTQGRAYKVGSGLDRSKSLFGGDNTIWTTILKLASPAHGEPEYFILNQKLIVPNTSRLIKKAILKDHERYKLDNIVLENYEVTDLGPWLTDQNIPYELVSAHDTNQNASFPEFFRIAQEGRFHFPESLKELSSEMSTFSYTQRAGGKYSFGHSSQRFKDDRVYSVNWSIFSLRQAVMNLYVLGSFYCKNKSKRRSLCFLMNGQLELLCKESCQAYAEVDAMFREYKQHQFDSELTLPEFFFEKIKHIGCRISQAA